MIWTCLLVLSCAAAALGSGYQGYYVPDHHPQPLVQHYGDGGRHGVDALREYDHAGHRHLQNLHDLQAARDFEAGQKHALRDVAKQAVLDQGAHAVQHAAGGQRGHVQHAHDRGHYEREKKYGYEKAYGYERESKSHDRDHNEASHAAGYDHRDERGHHHHGKEALRDLAEHSNRHHRGSDALANRHVLLDVAGDRNRGKELLSRYNDGLREGNIHLLPYAPALRTYLPMILRKNYVDDIDGSLNRFRYLSGIHGLGGLRGYGLGYGYNPLRYGRYGAGVLDLQEPLNIHEPLNIDDHELRYLDNEHLRDVKEPVYYMRH